MCEPKRQAGRESEIARKNNKANKILERLESNELLLKLAFGAAIVFMGFTFVPVRYDVVGKWGVSLVFLSLGVLMIVFCARRISENPIFISIRHAFYLVFGLIFIIGSVFLLIFVISKLSALFSLTLLFII